MLNQDGCYKKNIFILSIIVFATVLLIYTPILGAKFAYHNDYRIWDYDSTKHFFGYLETRHIICIGRPALAILLNIQIFFIQNMNDVHISQIISVFSIAGTAVAFFFYLQKSINISNIGAVFLATLTFTLPSMSINSFWITNYASEIIALWISFTAYILIQPSKKLNKTPYWIYGIVGGLLYFDMMIYPPATFFFLSLVTIKLIYGPKDNQQTNLNQLFAQVMVLLVSSIVYFITIKYFFKPFLIKHTLLLEDIIKGVSWKEYFHDIDTSMVEYSLSYSPHFFEKLAQLKKLLLFVTTAWFTSKHSYYLLLSACIMAGAVLYWAYKSTCFTKFKTIPRIFLGSGMLITLSILTALPFLAGHANYEINYRILFPTMVLVPTLLVFAAENIYMQSRRYPQWVSYVLITIFATFILASSMSSLHRLNLVKNRAEFEYHQLFNALRCKLTEDTQRIHIQLPFVPPKNSLYLAADFGLNGTDIKLEGIVKAALQELGKTPSDYTIDFNPSLQTTKQDLNIRSEYSACQRKADH
jgi:hypothetical protein